MKGPQMSKSFTLAAAEANGSLDDALPFTMEGDETQLYAYAPTEGQLVLLLGVVDLSPDDTSEGGTVANDVMSVFFECMEESTALHLRKRLRSRADRFGLQDIMNIIQWLVEEASARPTSPPSGSTSSPGTAGTRSTAPARRQASTRSTTRQRASAT